MALTPQQAERLTKMRAKNNGEDSKEVNRRVQKLRRKTKAIQRANRNYSLTEYQINQLIALYRKKKTYPQIAEEMSISHSLVTSTVQRLQSYGKLKRRRTPTIKLTDAELKQLKQLHQEGYAYSEIAKIMSKPQNKLNYKIAKLQKAGELEIRSLF